MSKKWKKLLIIGLILLLLLAAYGITMTFMDGKKKEDKGKQDVAVSQVGTEHITSFSYSSEDTGNEFLTFYKEKDIWYYQEDKEFPVNQKIVTVMAKAAADLNATRKLEGDVQELSAYGLDHPAVTVHLNLKDGSKKSFYVGSYNESTESYYLRMDGDSSIYLVDGNLKLNFTLGLYDLVQMEKFPLVETGSFVHVKVEKNDGTVEIKGTVKDDAKKYVGQKNYLEQEKTWLVSHNGSEFQEGNQESLSALIGAMSGFEFYREVNYKASEQDLESYGLKNPAVTLTVDYQVLDESTARVEQRESNVNEVVLDTMDKQYVLYIGDKTKDTNYANDYYVRLKGSDIVYTMEKSTIEAILDININDYIK